MVREGGHLARTGSKARRDSQGGGRRAARAGAGAHRAAAEPRRRGRAAARRAPRAMLFPYGWPVRLQTATSPHEGYIFLHADQEYVVAVTEVSVQVWAGAQARVRLGQVHLCREDVDAFGTHVAACWSPDRARLAVLVSRRRRACARARARGCFGCGAAHTGGSQRLNAARAPALRLQAGPARSGPAGAAAAGRRGQRAPGGAGRGRGPQLGLRAAAVAAGSSGARGPLSAATAGARLPAPQPQRRRRSTRS